MHVEETRRETVEVLNLFIYSAKMDKEEERRERSEREGWRGRYKRVKMSQFTLVWLCA